ncbi:hypothetical protein PMG11_02980 [Penicillium brasilianum]|uniref:Uncharacterized protein n=1 Tax=Penicillium brasilianum TaxID=104259 RepID=A0A0F7TP75_PENBI|nr:hypothetical protein PMG11_02980 [Penicillium brasilianum]
MSQDHVAVTGTFIPVPTAFDGTPEGLANAVKIGIVPTTSVTRESGRQAEQVLDVAIVTHRAVIDFAAVDTSEIIFKKLERDCELMKDALGNYPEEINQVLKLVCSGQATTQAIESAAAALAKLDLTEEAFREQGGGFIGLVVALAVCVFVAGCRGCAHTNWAERGGEGGDEGTD